MTKKQRKAKSTQTKKAKAHHQHDIAYKRLFAHKELVVSLLQDFIPQNYLTEFDFATLEHCPSAYTTPLFREKFGDHVWRMRRKNAEWSYLLVMLEFQSTIDDWMPLRILIYTSLLWEGLIAADQLCNGKLPLVLPIVLYNGDKQWDAPRDISDLIVPCAEQLLLYQPKQSYFLLDENRVNHDELQKNTDSISACLIRLEQAHSYQEIEDIMSDILNCVRQYPRLLQTIVDWINNVLQFRFHNTEVIDFSTLEGGKGMFAERVAQWKEEFINQGRIEGRAEGIAEGEARGEARGEAKGEAKGRQKTIMKIVKNMFAGNLPIEQIAQFTGLSIQDVQKLVSQTE